jgi:putative ABC transport system ATP-binding protein
MSPPDDAAPATPPESSRTTALLHLEGIGKVYGEGRTTRVEALRHVDLDVARGEFVAVLGRSGSGKSTLLHILGCLDRPSRGVYLLDGIDTASLTDLELSRVRNRRIGFVFQAFHLLPGESAVDNVALPLLYRGIGPARARAAAREALSAVGLSDRFRHRPGEMSGGEQQRVALARALAKEPQILLADEPTGNLDSETGAAVLKLLEEIHRRGITVVLITHDPAFAGVARRQVLLRDGRLESAGG